MGRRISAQTKALRAATVARTALAIAAAAAVCRIVAARGAGDRSERNGVMIGRAARTNANYAETFDLTFEERRALDLLDAPPLDARSPGVSLRRRFGAAAVLMLLDDLELA
jgi:hypothetical protein